jgi:hypothetical protein
MKGSTEKVGMLRVVEEYRWQYQQEIIHLSSLANAHIMLLLLFIVAIFQLNKITIVELK